MWEALNEIADEQGKTRYMLVNEVIKQKRAPAHMSVTAALRVYIVEYYRELWRANTKRAAKGG